MNDNKGMQPNQSILIVGAGIGGMQSALLLAEAGHKVYLLDSAPGIGGSMHLLDLTFPTNSCGLCLMLPGRAAYCPTIECDLHCNIEILPYAEVTGVEGEVGNFTVMVRNKPRYVRADLCNNCGLCAEVCPVERPDRYELPPGAFSWKGGRGGGKAIYRPPTRAIPSAYVIDMDYCLHSFDKKEKQSGSRCGRCVEVCPVEAIDLSMDVVTTLVGVGAIILSPGFEPFDARLKGEYGFGHYDNVLTSLQFERMVSLSGSTGADITRPSDGQTPKRVAFIQCVGSREAPPQPPPTVRGGGGGGLPPRLSGEPALSLSKGAGGGLGGHGYCSSVCCMYTAKQVVVAKRLRPDLDVTVFFMDIRAHGKDFDEYFDGVESLPGVHYRRGMVSSIHQYQQTRNLRLNCVAEDGSLQDEDFDMVVLSVGFAPPPGFQQLGQSLGVELNQYGFCVTDTFTPNESSRPGILVGGAFREPKDIPGTVVEASAVAANAARLLGNPSLLPSLPPQGGDGRKPKFRKFRKTSEILYGVTEGRPRVGVFLCDCRGEIGGVIDLEASAAHAQGLEGVAVAQTMDNACRPGGLEQIGQAVAEHELNRVVVAGCAMRLYQPAFGGMMRKAGLNPGLLERVNLRGEIARVHSHSRPQRSNGKATGKAKELIEMGVASARLRKPVYPTVEEVTQRALVIGGGLAGMTAALSLAEMGYGVDLVERSAELGGQFRELRYTLTGEDDPAAFLASLIERVEGDECIRVYREAQVEAVSGRVGQFQATVTLSGGEKETLEHGAIIVATGGHEVTPTEYLYGQDPRVVTQRELESLLVESAALLEENPQSAIRNLKSVVMIQCVGSREPERPYCSRVCCSRAVANALKIKEQNPEANVFVLYREMRTYGFREDYYREARSKGVTFLRYELPVKPQVSANPSASPSTGSGETSGQAPSAVLSAGGDGLTVRLKEPITGEKVVIHAGVVVLSTGIESNRKEAQTLAGVLDVPLDKNGFFQEEYIKMRPLDFGRRGIFMCGLAHSPRFADEAITQAQGAAMRAAALLAQNRLESPSFVVQVDTQLCSACGLCVEVCPFGARVLEPGAAYAEVIEVLCQGCGTCVAVCPNKASDQKMIEVGQVYAMLDAVIKVR